jgi:hypothetical protein
VELPSPTPLPFSGWLELQLANWTDAMPQLLLAVAPVPGTVKSA